MNDLLVGKLRGGCEAVKQKISYPSRLQKNTRPLPLPSFLFSRFHVLDFILFIAILIIIRILLFC
jgi:hypothetical protein